MKRRLRRAIKVYVGLKRRQSWLSQHAGGKERANQNEGKAHKRPTICYGQPSVLFLDLEFVPDSLRLCILSFSVHRRLRIVRRLHSRFHVRFLRGGGRHVYSAGCRQLWPASTGCVSWRCGRLFAGDHVTARCCDGLGGRVCDLLEMRQPEPARVTAFDGRRWLAGRAGSFNAD